MKSIKLAIILLVGQCAFTPLVALSEIKGNIGATVSVDGIDYTCYGVEKAGNRWKSSDIRTKCKDAGYVRQSDYTPTTEDVRNSIAELAATANYTRNKCLNFTGTLDSQEERDIAFTCAGLGVNVLK